MGDRSIAHPASRTGNVGLGTFVGLPNDVIAGGDSSNSGFDRNNRRLGISFGSETEISSRNLEIALFCAGFLFASQARIAARIEATPPKTE